MLTTASFLILAKWAGILTIALTLLTIIAFIFKWGLKFRLVGASSFMVVLTVGLFVFSVIPLTRTLVPGSVHYSLVYDNGASQTVISLPPTVTDAELEATLKQAAADLYSYGRGGGSSQLSIRARTVIHPESGISVPLLLGDVKRSLADRTDEEMDIKIYPENLAKLPRG
jgi:dolichyl-phosphate-mannose--protein O-mannosyl transferase